MDLFEYAKAQAAPEEVQAEDAVLTVSKLTALIKKVLTGQFGGRSFWVKGEISNFKGKHTSGHMYFRIKDEGAVLNCVFFSNRNRSLGVELRDGLEVLALGRIDVWERGGSYQLVVEEIRPGGAGELFLRFEQLKCKLEEEGLFRQERKRPLPAFVDRIGLVTSPTGAVIRDIIHVIRRRWPFVTLVLRPVKVQGEGAREDIARAVSELNDPRLCLDILIIGRGGGSIEDLWAFNEEIVARAVAASRLPVVSAVGHQTDRTIADFVADSSAATPSQAAELVVPDMMEFERQVSLRAGQVAREIARCRAVLKHRVQGLMRAAPLRDPRSLIRSRAQRLDMAIERLTARILSRREGEAVRFARCSERLGLRAEGFVRMRRLRKEKLEGNLNLLNPLAVLSRGYSVVLRPDGSIVRRSEQVGPGERVGVRLHEGKLKCLVEEISNAS